MDFGFLRASTFDYSRPDKSQDQVVTSFDGFNSYLLVVDKATKYTWVYLCKSKEPPIHVINLHLDQFGYKSGFIRTDQGGELAGSDDFITSMAERHFIVEPTCANSPNQNKQAEKYYDIFGVTVRVLLYGSGLPACFWSVALIHVAYLHNRRVHKSTLMTPFEAWNGFKPDLRTLHVFGSRVCVKRTGKRRSKLDRHDFTGIFVGYTATDENIRYIDVHTQMLKSSHHAIFDEAWYLQPHRPPFAQMLYDIGLEPDEELVIPTSQPVSIAPFPPLATKKPSPLPKLTTIIPLPLRASTPPTAYAAAAARSTFDDDLIMPNSTPPAKRLEHEMIMQNGISHKDVEMVYLSPLPYNNAFEEVLDLRRYNPTISPTAGIICEEKSSQLFLRKMQKSTPATKIQAWRSRLRGARILEVNDTPVATSDKLAQALLRLKDKGAKSCIILLAHSAICEGLVETGIPQVNIDMLNNRHSLMSVDVMTQEQFDNWFSNLPKYFYEIVNEGGVLNLTTESHKLTRRKLLNQDDWKDWETSEHLQLMDQYEKQFMFGTPCKPTKKSAVFNLIWTYLIKKEDGRKKACCTCDGSTRGGQVRVLDHTYANSLDQTGSRLFYALTAAENMMCFGADVSNAFGDAPPPKQGFFVRPDAAFKEWWEAKGREPTPEGYVIPVLAAMQGHPESPPLWEKHIDKIL
jgi:hypothetical protein